MNKLPLQRLSYAEKIKDDHQWAKDTMDAIIKDYGVVTDLPTSKGRATKLSNYQLYNNIINQADFEKECNPLGVQVGQFSDIIQPYNKTYNKIQVLLGEELRRKFDYKVVLTNDTGVRSKLFYRDHLLRNYVHQQLNTILQEFNLQGLEVDEASLMDPADVSKFMATKYLDSKEIAANKILKYLTKKLNLKDLKNDGFKHGLIAGEEIVYVSKRNGEPYVSIVNPLGFFFHKSHEVKFVEDSAYAGHQTLMSLNDILDTFGSELSEEDKKRLEEPYVRNSSSAVNSTMVYDKRDYSLDQYRAGFDSYTSESDSPLHNVFHVEWKTFKKVGFINYTNEYGDPELDIVSEDFEVPPFAKKSKDTYSWEIDSLQYSLTWEWIEEVWEGIKIAHDIYVNIRPKEYQMRDLDNPRSVKLGYHGTIYSSMNAEPISLMSRMRPFQYLYFLVMHKLKKFIAQDMGKVFNIDVTMIPPNLGPEKMMYYLQNMNIHFYNPLANADQPGWSQRPGIVGASDMSTTEIIIGYVNLLNSIDQQLSDVSGVSRQREGQVMANEAVTNAQSNIQMSSVITEVYFHSHNLLWQNVLNSLIDLASACYKHKGLTRQFILDDMSLATLELSPDSLTNASFGVFITNSPEEQAIFDSLQQWGLGLIQNDKAKFSDMIKIYKAVSTEELEQQILESEKQQQEQQTEERKFQQQLQQQNIEAQQQAQQQQFAHEIQLKEMEILSKSLPSEDTSYQEKLLALKEKETEAKIKAIEFKNKEIKSSSNK